MKLSKRLAGVHETSVSPNPQHERTKFTFNPFGNNIVITRNIQRFAKPVIVLLTFCAILSMASGEATDKLVNANGYEFRIGTWIKLEYRQEYAKYVHDRSHGDDIMDSDNRFFYAVRGHVVSKVTALDTNGNVTYMLRKYISPLRENTNDRQILDFRGFFFEDTSHMNFLRPLHTGGMNPDDYSETRYSRAASVRGFSEGARSEGAPVVTGEEASDIQLCSEFEKSTKALSQEFRRSQMNEGQRDDSMENFMPFLHPRSPTVESKSTAKLTRPESQGTSSQYPRGMIGALPVRSKSASTDGRRVSGKETKGRRRKPHIMLGGEKVRGHSWDSSLCRVRPTPGAPREPGADEKHDSNARHSL